jgi:hypothetical protein
MLKFTSTNIITSKNVSKNIFKKLILFVLILSLITPSLSQTCTQQADCHSINQPAYVSRTNSEIIYLDNGRSIAGITSGTCGCYSLKNCQIRTPCLYDSVDNTDPGICACNVNSDCSNLYFDSCVNNNCVKTCTNNLDCTNNLFPVCTSGICGCNNDNDCSVFPVCNLAQGVCIGCTSNNDCKNYELCNVQNNQCFNITSSDNSNVNYYSTDNSKYIYGTVSYFIVNIVVESVYFVLFLTVFYTLYKYSIKLTKLFKRLPKKKKESQDVLVIK